MAVVAHSTNRLVVVIWIDNLEIVRRLVCVENVHAAVYPDWRADGLLVGCGQISNPMSYRTLLEAARSTSHLSTR
jgi:hypothetical protein